MEIKVEHASFPLGEDNPLENYGRKPGEAPDHKSHREVPGIHAVRRQVGTMQRQVCGIGFEGPGNRCNTNIRGYER